MSVTVMAEVWRVSEATGTDRLVLLALADRANDDGECWPGEASLADKCKVSERTVRRSVRTLEALGELEVDRRGKRLTNTYRVTVGHLAPNVPGQSDRSVIGQSDRSPERDRTTVAGSDRTMVADPRNPPGDPPVFADSPSNPDPEPPDPVRLVFDEWVAVTGRTDRTKLDARRRRLIARALADYPLADVLAAVRGWRHSPHHRGENAAGIAYHDLGLLLRNAEKIEAFRDLERRSDRAAVAATVAAPERETVEACPSGCRWLGPGVGWVDTDRCPTHGDDPGDVDAIGVEAFTIARETRGPANVGT